MPTTHFLHLRKFFGFKNGGEVHGKMSVSRERGFFIRPHTAVILLSSRSLDKNRAMQDGGFMFGDIMKVCSGCKKEKDLSELARVKRWIEKNPKKFLERVKRRYEREKKADGNITVKEWRELKKRYNYTCLCCKRREPEIELTLDHVVPLSRGGTDTINNAQPLCGLCNRRKGTKIIDYR